MQSALAGQTIGPGRGLDFLAAIAPAGMFARRLSRRVGGQSHCTEFREPACRSIEQTAVVAGQAAAMHSDRFRQRSVQRSGELL